MVKQKSKFEHDRMVIHVYTGGWRLVERGAQWTLVRWSATRNQLTAPIYGEYNKSDGAQTLVAAGWSTRSIRDVATWCSRATAYRRLADALEYTAQVERSGVVA